MFKLKNLLFISFSFLFTVNIFSQKPERILQENKNQPTPFLGKENQEQSKSKTIYLFWKGVVEEKVSEEASIRFLYFKGASNSPDNFFLPSFETTEELKTNPGKAETELLNQRFEELNQAEVSALNSSQIASISSQILVVSGIKNLKKKPHLSISFVPLRKNFSTGKVEKLVSFEIKTNFIETKKKALPVRTFASNSVLATGEWFKIGVTRDGVYKIPYSFLKTMGIEMSSINPQNLRMYGNGGGMLPVQNSEYRQDDLIENSIYLSGENDGKFDPEDYILFYGQSPHQWFLSGSQFRHKMNLYTDTNFYFISASMGPGRRISERSSLSGFSKTVSTFDDYDFYEKDLFNPIRSGREWLGEAFNIVTDYDFVFSFPNISNQNLVKVRASVAGRTTSGQNIFTIKENGESVGTIPTNSVSGNYTDNFALANENTFSFSPSGASINVNISMSKGNSGAQGWLNFIEINARRNLVFTGSQILFRDIQSIGPGNAAFQIKNANDKIIIWDVSNPQDVKKQKGILTGEVFEFISSTDSLREFAAFDISSPLPSPSFKEKVAVQNLHAEVNPELIIVTNPLFEKEAKELGDFHVSEDGLSVLVATTEQIFNEFSSGKQDVTAIKDFVKMFYDRAGSNTALLPKYLLFMGDGSYDFKNRISGNTNFVPAFQSSESLSPTASYVTDDYCGLLDDDEGESTGDLVDLGIGRLVVKNNAEAQNAVNKIKHYYSRETLGPWRNYNTFIGDDEDGNIHMNQANSIAGIVETNYKKYNVDKIMFDAYKQQVNAGGQRYPDVNSAIDRRIDLGSLMVTYIGHGGELGWAHERVLEVSQINKWKNSENLPLFITATCEFSRFDDPQRTSAGEFVFLNPNGGGIGLLTTTRLVYSSPNYEIVQAFTDSAFDEIDSVMPRLGDILQATKMKGPKNINSRNFTLLGDPALRLAYPNYNVVTTQTPDTMKALEKVTVKGFVANEKGKKLSDFNGVIYPLVFDKASSINSLNNDNNFWDSMGTPVPVVFRFKSQKNILFKGKASVKNGDFEYSFVVPKDISYSLGKGRISHYGENGETDASGYFENFFIGGSDSNAVADNSGPRIQLFLNDEKFVFGGVTNENPKLFAKFFDENGINTAGNGIGHDIVAVLDGNSSKAILLNDYYEAEINSYQKGYLRYPLADLMEGKHSLSIRAFDVYNNSGEAQTEFIVAREANLALDHILNYPNPFTTQTAFYFEHNQPGQNLDISIQIFTVSGKLIKSLDSYVFSDTFRAGPIFWDGRDDFGDKIGKGVYVYKLKVIAPTGQVVNKFEKLVVLN